MNSLIKKNKYIAINIALSAFLITFPLTAFSQNSNELLINRANTLGKIRVIAQLNLNYQTEGLLSSTQAIENQRSTIAQTQNTLLDRFSGQDISNVKTFTTVPYLALETDAAGLEELLNTSDLITSVQEDIPVPPMLNESIPLINADDVHAQGFDGSGWAVAVLDTGVRSSHEFLDSGKVVSEACYSMTYAPFGSTSLCPDGSNAQTGTGSGVNCDPSINGCSHGTHVAGIVAGTDGTTVTQGVAPGANIIAIQVFSRFDNPSYCGSEDPCVLSYTSDQMSALERVYTLRTTYNIAAVNMSLGGGEYTDYCDTSSLKDIIDNLRAEGIATVIASGNDSWDGSIGAPGCISSAVTVGATDDADAVASYSNHADMVDLMAPGSAITSSTADSDTSYAGYYGTSMATPHVAGTFAVMKSNNSAWTVDDIENLLKTTGVDVTRTGITKPRIDLLAAVSVPQEEIVHTITPPSDSSVVQGEWLQFNVTHTNNSDNQVEYTAQTYLVLPDETVKSGTETSLSLDSQQTKTVDSYLRIPANALTGSYSFGTTITYTESGEIDDDSFDFTVSSGESSLRKRANDKSSSFILKQVERKKP